MLDLETKLPDETERRSVSLLVRSWAVVDEVNTRYAFGNISAALRYIISEYVRLSTQEADRLAPDSN